MGPSRNAPNPVAGARIGSYPGSFIVDPHGTILGFDGGMESLTGWSAIEVVGQHKTLSRVVDAGDGEEAMPLYEGDIPSVEGDCREQELRLNRRNGGTVLVDTRIRRLEGPGERLLVTVLRVLAQSAATVQLVSGTGYDALTGLLDRGTFLRRLNDAFASARRKAGPLALILADVDHLRNVNDAFGFDQGSEVLKKIAGIFRVNFGNDHAIGRLENDTFGVILTGLGRGDARQLAATVRTVIERFRFFPDDEDAAPVTMSIGAASFPADADSPQDLVSRAGEAMDEARALGRNRVWCYVRRPRVPLEVPVFFDAAEAPLVGFSRDLSPSGLFVQTCAPIEIGMRCAFAFPIPGHAGKVHVIGRIVRSVVPPPNATEGNAPGMGVEFERFGGPSDQRAIEAYLHANERTSARPDTAEHTPHR